MDTYRDSRLHDASLSLKGKRLSISSGNHTHSAEIH